jgi:uncharacterized protein (DUF1501 family)
MAITRRQFIRRGAVSAAALATFGPRLSWLPGTGVSWAACPGDVHLVFVQLYGGNDGLGTVYPIAGAERTKYEEFRPSLKQPKNSGEFDPDFVTTFGSSSVLSIGANSNGSSYALHPAMDALHALWGAGRVAVMPGVHYPFADHSHFRSEVIWYTADPLGSSGQGWVGRYLNGSGCYSPTDVPAVMLGRDLNPLFTPTQTSLFAVNDLSDLRFPASNQLAQKQAAFSALCDESNDRDPGLYPEAVSIGNTGVATVAKMQDYYKSGSGLANAGKVEALLLDGDGNYNPGNDLVYGSPINPSASALIADMGLAQDLRHVAAMIRADVGARFFHVAIGGFDSHSNQENGFFHSFLLREVSESIAAFYNEMAQSITLPGGYSGYRTGNLASKVLVVVFSEFGRTIRQNSYNANNAGTDHAASSPLIALGGTVVGGQYGAYPLLDDPGENEDDLKMTHDFRDVFGTVLTRWLGVPLADVGPGPTKILPATTATDPLGNNYVTFTPIGFLP